MVVAQVAARDFLPQEVQRDPVERFGGACRDPVAAVDPLAGIHPALDRHARMMVAIGIRAARRAGTNPPRTLATRPATIPATPGLPRERELLQGRVAGTERAAGAHAEQESPAHPVPPARQIVH